MPVSLLRTGTIFSLEFAPEEKADVWAGIQQLFGRPKITPGVASATIDIDGEAFIYQDEWDDPCLISSSTRGKAILERLAERLAESGEARLRTLHDTLNSSIEKGGAHDQHEVNAFLAIEATKLASEDH